MVSKRVRQSARRRAVVDLRHFHIRELLEDVVPVRRLLEILEVLDEVDGTRTRDTRARLNLCPRRQQHVKNVWQW